MRKRGSIERRRHCRVPHARGLHREGATEFDARLHTEWGEHSRTETRRSHSRVGLQGNDYILTVGRIIPDRGLHYVIEAFAGVSTDLKLVIVGSEFPRTEYSRRLEEMADDRVIFTGGLYGEALEELYSNCRFYVLASEVEGLPITVCEAMAFGRCALLSDIPENAEVGGDVAVYFKARDVNGLRESLKRLLEDESGVAERGQEGRRRVEIHFNWDRLASTLEEYYVEMLEKRRGSAR